MITDDFTAYAVKIELHSIHTASPETIKKQMNAFLSLVASECSDNGAYLIGHIKCVLESASGFYAASITAPTDAPRVRGEMRESDTFEMIVNVLLYGLDKSTVRSITKAAVPVVFTEMQYKTWDIEEESSPIHFA